MDHTDNTSRVKKVAFSIRKLIKRGELIRLVGQACVCFYCIPIYVCICGCNLQGCMRTHEGVYLNRMFYTLYITYRTFRCKRYCIFIEGILYRSTTQFVCNVTAYMSLVGGYIYWKIIGYFDPHASPIEHSSFNLSGNRKNVIVNFCFIFF